ncbi:serine/threonine-protein kinase [Nocardia sp. NPDC051030]|uniref:serine/threonine-protein kinase n=1 Tax=Nocardia sp. NPDC051030 TaxID=3155162 RepID=UPI00342CA753
MPLVHGDVLAGYTLDRVIGVGGMGKVYLARHPKVDRDVALKALHEDFAVRQTARAWFALEIALLAGLEHPNIVAVYDHSAVGDEHLWYAMEFVYGISAARLVREGGALPVARAVDWVTQAARGVDHAHAAGMLHRDIRPANLLVEIDDEDRDLVLVTDFGIARSLDGTATDVTSSFAYAAPERFSGMIDQRADVYSLGCTLYEFLTGRPPFPLTDPAAVLAAHRDETPPAPSSVRPGLPPVFDRVIATALAKDPAARYASCGALAEAAQQALASLNKPLAASTIPITAGLGGRRFPRPLTVGAAAVCVGTVALLAIMMFNDSDSSDDAVAARPAATSTALPTTTTSTSLAPQPPSTPPPPPPPSAEDITAAARAQCGGRLQMVQDLGVDGAIGALVEAPEWAFTSPPDQAIAIEAIRLAGAGECG